MEKPSQEVVVKNVSKGPLSLSAAGYAKIFIDSGKTHTFADTKIFAYYQKAAQGLKGMGLVEITMGGKTDKVIPTPALDDHKMKMEAAAKKAADAKAKADAEEAAKAASLAEAEEAEAKAMADAAAADKKASSSNKKNK